MRLPAAPHHATMKRDEATKHISKQQSYYAHE